MIPPGRVIYCRRLKEGKTQSSYDSVWIPPEALMKEGFLVSSKMLKDHLCDSVCPRAKEAGTCLTCLSLLMTNPT